MQELVKQTAEFYQKKLGPLPYKRVAIAETGFQTNFAMEYPNLAIYSRDLYENGRINHWIGHEIAHFWWYNAISTWEPIYGWLDEGLSEYAYYSYLSEGSEEIVQNIVDDVSNDVQTLAGKYPHSSLNIGLKDFRSKEEWHLTWYKKSVLVLNGLEQQIGKDRFFLFLNNVHQTYQKQVIGPEHLDQVLSDVLGKKWIISKKMEC